MMKTIETKTVGRSPIRGLRYGLALLLALAGSARAQFYAVTDLGTLGGTNGMAYGINNHEQIVGAAQTGTGNYHGFLFDSGRMMDLGRWAEATVGLTGSTIMAGWSAGRRCR